MSNATATKKAAPVVHFEIGCRNSEKTTEFYRSVFSWSINAMGPASMIQAAEHGIGGHISSLGHEPHNYVTVYINVDRIEDYLDQIEKNGGKRVVGPVVIPTGRFAWFNDPEGNLLGLFDNNPQ
jgi:hypothetical protein